MKSRKCYETHQNCNSSACEREPVTPKFTVGQRVKAIAFTDCFDKFIPERTGLTVTEINPINGQSIPAYFRVKANADNDWEYIEGAERYFAAE